MELASRSETLSRHSSLRGRRQSEWHFHKSIDAFLGERQFWICIHTFLNCATQANDFLLGFPLGWKRHTVNYRAQIKPWLVFQPVAQYFQTISGNPHRASGIVLGFRTYLRL